MDGIDRLHPRHLAAMVFVVTPEKADPCMVGLGYAALSIFYVAMATLSGQGRPGPIAASFFVGACVPRGQGAW